MTKQEYLSKRMELKGMYIARNTDFMPEDCVNVLKYTDADELIIHYQGKIQYIDVDDNGVIFFKVALPKNLVEDPFSKYQYIYSQELLQKVEKLKNQERWED